MKVVSYVYNTLSKIARRFMEKMRIIGLVMFLVGIILLVVWSQGYTAFLLPAIIVGGGGAFLLFLSSGNKK
jgi:hypothetical protein